MLYYVIEKPSNLVHLCTPDINNAYRLAEALYPLVTATRDGFGTNPGSTFEVLDHDEAQALAMNAAIEKQHKAYIESGIKRKPTLATIDASCIRQTIAPTPTGWIK